MAFCPWRSAPHPICETVSSPCVVITVGHQIEKSHMTVPIDWSETLPQQKPLGLESGRMLEVFEVRKRVESVWPGRRAVQSNLCSA